jgi:threonine aldolase
MPVIDLRSDTLTRPTPAMIRAMAAAQVGDDAYEEDRPVRELQDYCAEYFGKPAALFMPSGTMSNQVAIRCLTKPGDEVICDASYHLNFFESAQAADLGKVVLNAADTADGILTVDVVRKAIDSKARWNRSYASPGLVWIENTISTHGGSVFPLDTLQDVYAWCRNSDIPVFVDGARLLNACIAQNIGAAKYAASCDALTVCFSKGLGAPFGSILLGKRDFISDACRYRKWFGGALHQSGFMAAAALYAIKNNVNQLLTDHENAATLARILAEESCVFSKVATNMVLFDVDDLGISAAEFVRRAKAENVLLLAWRNTQVRAVTSSNVNRPQSIEAGYRLARLVQSIQVEKDSSRCRSTEPVRATVLQLVEPILAG